MRGALKMGWGSIFNFIGYFVFGLPIAWYLAFEKDLSLKGIWFGPVFAVAFLTVTYNIVIATIDWRALIDTIEERTRKENELKAQL